MKYHLIARSAQLIRVKLQCQSAFAIDFGEINCCALQCNRSEPSRGDDVAAILGGCKLSQFYPLLYFCQIQTCEGHNKPSASAK